MSKFEIKGKEVIKHSIDIALSENDTLAIISIDNNILFKVTTTGNCALYDAKEEQWKMGTWKK